MTRNHPIKTGHSSVEESAVLLIERQLLKILRGSVEYIHDNFTQTNFFTLGQTDQASLGELLSLIRSAEDKCDMSKEEICLRLTREQFRILDAALWYVQNFGDDIDAFEALHEHVRQVTLPKLVVTSDLDEASS